MRLDRVDAGGGRRPLRRAGARPARAHAARESRARARPLLRRRRLPLRPARVRAVPAALDRDRRHGQARRQDRDHRARRASCSRASGRSSSSRWAAAARPSRRSPSVAPDVDALLELSRAGRHAASDYLETAALSGVPTIGCRRCGGGLAGAVVDLERRRGRAAGRRAGARARPVRRERSRAPAGRDDAAASSSSTRSQDHEVVTGYLNTYRHLLSDLVVLTMADDGLGLGGAARSDRGARAARRRRSRSGRGHSSPSRDGASRSSRRRARRRTRASPSTSPRRTAPTSCTSPATSPTAARCAEELESVDADVFLIELKAAAIDVVAEAGRARGVDVVLAGSDVRSTGELELDAELQRLADEARREPRSAAVYALRTANGVRRLWHRVRDESGTGSDSSLTPDAARTDRRGHVSEQRKGERHFLGGPETPYSKGVLARALVAIGLTDERAYELARRTEADLARAARVRRRPRPPARARRRRCSASRPGRARSGGCAASATCRSSTCP